MCGWLTHCVLLAEEANLVYSLFEWNGLKPLYRNEIFAFVGVVNGFAVVMASVQDFERRGSPLRGLIRKEDAGSAGPVTRPTPTNPYPGALTHTRSPMFRSLRVLLNHAPPPADMNPYWIASGQERDFP